MLRRRGNLGFVVQSRPDLSSMSPMSYCLIFHPPWSAGRELRGWEIDRTARDVIAEAGLGQYFVHRTGHSLGESVHGNGVHMDDYETHDDRRLLPGTGFTIEPGVYFDTFGIRSEINMFVGRGQAVVTGPVQAKITALMAAGSE